MRVLEWTFISLLLLMVIVSGLFALVVVTRLVEPGGIRSLLRRLAGK
jgi:hypothetical protein